MHSWPWSGRIPVRGFNQGLFAIDLGLRSQSLAMVDLDAIVIGTRLCRDHSRPAGSKCYRSGIESLRINLHRQTWQARRRRDFRPTAPTRALAPRRAPRLTRAPTLAHNARLRCVLKRSQLSRPLQTRLFCPQPPMGSFGTAEAYGPKTDRVASCCLGKVGKRHDPNAIAT